MSSPETSATIADLLWDCGAITVDGERPFTLAAGWVSPVYVDCRKLIGDPAVRRKVTDIARDFAAPIVSSANIEVIVGAETAGIPFAAWLADALDLKLAFVRKHPLGIGRNAQIEGASVEGRRVLLVDDLISYGSSKLVFSRALRSAGAIIEHAMAIFFNDIFPGVTERLQADGLQLHALSRWNDLLGSRQVDQLSPSVRAELDAFRAQPSAWSLRHGGRGEGMQGTNIRPMRLIRSNRSGGGAPPMAGFFLELIEKNADGSASGRRLIGQSGTLDEARERASFELDRADRSETLIGYRITDEKGQQFDVFFIEGGEKDQI